MEKLVIRGGYPLEGEIPVSGAKNSALPALAACLLTADPVKLSRVPRVRDIATMEKLLKYIGAKVDVQGGQVTVETGHPDKPEAPYDLVKTMRASSLVLGPPVPRTAPPGGSMPARSTPRTPPTTLPLQAPTR